MLLVEVTMDRLPSAKRTADPCFKEYLEAPNNKTLIQLELL